MCIQQLQARAQIHTQHKPKGGGKEIENKKIINNEQALNGIYFRDGDHASVLVS